MTKRIADVLVGVATLSVGAKAGNRAEWSAVQAKTGTHSVKLSKEGSGDYGSSGVQFNATGNAAAQKISDFATQTLAWGWDHFRSAIAAYWEQLELHFEDPNTGAWVDITVQVDVMATGGAAWGTKDLEVTDLCMFGGWSEKGGSWSNWVPAAISDVATAIQTAETNAGGDIANAADWLLTRVKVELWETTPARSVYIDDIVIDGVTYTLEPGGADVAAVLLSGPYTEIGYTEDGVTFTYTADEADIEVEEETVPIDRVITKETIEVTCNMAQSSLHNLNVAIAGSVLSGNILTIGDGVNKKLNLKLEGTDPDGFALAIFLPKVTATGAVGTVYRRNEKNIVPVTFQALKPEGEKACTIVYNAA